MIRPLSSRFSIWARSVVASLVASVVASLATAQGSLLQGTYDGTPDLGFELTLTLETVGPSVQGRLVGEGIDFTLTGTIDARDPAALLAAGTAARPGDAVGAPAAVGFDLRLVPATGGLTLTVYELDPTGRAVPGTAIVTTFTARTSTPSAAGNPLAPPPNPVTNPLAPPTASSPWIGTFTGEGLELIVSAASATSAEGTVVVGGARYPFQVTFAPDGVGTGAFLVNGSQFALRLTLAGDVVSLQSDGAAYTLTRVGSAGSSPVQGATPGRPLPESRPAAPLLSIVSDLDEQDDAFESGESYELHVVDLEAGVPVTIGASSKDFDVYVLVVDPSTTTVLEVDDTDGLGTNVQARFVPEATGPYGVVVTSAYPKERGRYVLEVSAARDGGATTEGDARGVVATGVHGTVTYDDVDALLELLEFALRQVGVEYAFSASERDQAYALFATEFASLPPQEQAIYADARTIWTNVQRNWPSSSENEKYQFVIEVLALYFGEAQVRAWLGLPRTAGNGGGAGGGQGGAFEDWAAANGLDPYDANTSAAQSCWAAAGCSSYDPDAGFVYEDPSY